MHDNAPAKGQRTSFWQLLVQEIGNRTNDHHALDMHLGKFSEGANRVLRARDLLQSRELEEFHSGLRSLHKFIDRHLIDEEELIVPIVLKHGFEYYIE